MQQPDCYEHILVIMSHAFTGNMFDAGHLVAAPSAPLVSLSMSPLVEAPRKKGHDWGACHYPGCHKSGEWSDQNEP